MKRLVSNPFRPALTGLLISLSLALAACGASMSNATPATGGTSMPNSTPGAAIPATGSATVQSANNSQFGAILVTTDGRTLYTNTVYSPNTSKCVDPTCTGIWHPYTVSAAPTAGQGVTGTLGTITRSDGSMQVTYNQIPLYTFTGDGQPGAVNGNGLTDLGGTWHVALVNASAAPMAPTAPAAPTSGGSGGNPYP